MRYLASKTCPEKYHQSCGRHVSLVSICGTRMWTRCRFLLARLYLDSLLDKRTVKQVEDTAHGFTKGSASLDDLLDNAYQSVIDRIDSQLPGDSRLAKRVLSWITFAQRPLTRSKLRDALAIEQGSIDLDPRNRHDADDLESVCAGLVNIEAEGSTCRLSHYTAQTLLQEALKK